MYLDEGCTFSFQGEYCLQIHHGALFFSKDNKIGLARRQSVFELFVIVSYESLCRRVEARARKHDTPLRTIASWFLLLELHSFDVAVEPPHSCSHIEAKGAKPKVTQYIDYYFSLHYKNNL